MVYIDVVTQPYWMLAIFRFLINAAYGYAGYIAQSYVIHNVPAPTS